MIGILIVAHDSVGQAYQSVARHLFNELPKHMRIMGVAGDEDPEAVCRRIRLAIADLNAGDGTLILTDIFGATPCNIARRLLNDRVMMITGLNVPMMIKVLQYAPERSDLAVFAREVRDAAVEGILALTAGDCGC